jgi:hypothetical protein
MDPTFANICRVITCCYFNLEALGVHCRYEHIHRSQGENIHRIISCIHNPPILLRIAPIMLVVARITSISTTSTGGAKQHVLILQKIYSCSARSDSLVISACSSSSTITRVLL